MTSLAAQSAETAAFGGVAPAPFPCSAAEREDALLTRLLARGEWHSAGASSAPMAGRVVPSAVEAWSQQKQSAREERWTSRALRRHEQASAMRRWQARRRLCPCPRSQRLAVRIRRMRLGSRAPAPPERARTLEAPRQHHPLPRARLQLALAVSLARQSLRLQTKQHSKPRRRFAYRCPRPAQKPELPVSAIQHRRLGAVRTQEARRARAAPRPQPRP
mmetsp:Transcript_51847/g.119212  ORF Transcript_51847/g.119212 Transcript_51847/m.119212 type:complete len:218 (-) Transcript_51847:738-1391(-)